MYKMFRFIFRSLVPVVDTIELAVKRVNDPKYGWGFVVETRQGRWQPEFFVGDTKELSNCFAHYIHAQYGGRVSREAIHLAAHGNIVLLKPFHGKFKIKHGHYIELVINSYNKTQFAHVPIHLC